MFVTMNVEILLWQALCALEAMSVKACTLVHLCAQPVPKEAAYILPCTQESN